MQPILLHLKVPAWLLYRLFCCQLIVKWLLLLHTEGLIESTTKGMTATVGYDPLIVYSTIFNWGALAVAVSCEIVNSLKQQKLHVLMMEWGRFKMKQQSD